MFVFLKKNHSRKKNMSSKYYLVLLYELVCYLATEGITILFQMLALFFKSGVSNSRPWTGHCLWATRNWAMQASEAPSVHVWDPGSMWNNARPPIHRKTTFHRTDPYLPKGLGDTSLGNHIPLVYRKESEKNWEGSLQLSHSDPACSNHTAPVQNGWIFQGGFLPVRFWIVANGNENDLPLQASYFLPKL